MTSATSASKIPPMNLSLARLNMVEGQLRPNGIQDERILSAMETLPREVFCPPQMAGYCAIDEELPVLAGHRLLRPLVTARLIQTAAIQADDTVLDIAGATGYSAAILAGMAKKVVALEDDAAIAQGMRGALDALEIDNVECVSGKRHEGWKAEALCNAIIINGAVELVPEALLVQLAEGGRLVTVFRNYSEARAAHVSEIRLYEKIRGAISFRSVFDATASVLPDFAKPVTFNFA